MRFQYHSSSVHLLLSGPAGTALRSLSVDSSRQIQKLSSKYTKFHISVGKILSNTPPGLNRNIKTIMSKYPKCLETVHCTRARVCARACTNTHIWVKEHVSIGVRVPFFPVSSPPPVMKSLVS